MMSASKRIFLVFLLTFSLSCSPSDSHEITVKPGEDVTLQCWGPRDKAIGLLKWIRPDLRSEGFVYFFREKDMIYKDFQHESFVGRTELTDSEMKNGDFSVILKNVTICDTGTYECYIGKMNMGSKTELISSITLKVEDADHIVIISDSGKTITLPCQDCRNTNITVVEWSRSDLEPKLFFFYQNRRPDPENQHPSFKNRVELKDSQMKDGDASLVLKNAISRDSGTYECHVYQSGKKRKSIINLTVHEPGHTPGNTEDGGKKDGDVGLGGGLSAAVVLVFVVVVVYLIKHRPPERPYIYKPV